MDCKTRITALVINADGTRAGFQDKVQLEPGAFRPDTFGDPRNSFHE